MTEYEAMFQNMRCGLWIDKVTNPMYYSPFLTDPNFVSAMLLNVYLLIGGL